MDRADEGNLGDSPVSNYPEDMDKECIPLCDALNQIWRVDTTESCCGHGEHPFRIFFRTTSFKSLALVCYVADSCHSGAVGWKVEAITDCGMAKNRFVLEGPTGDYEGAAKIVKAIERLKK